MKPIATLALLLLMTSSGFACPQQTAQAALEDNDTMTESSSAPAEASADEEQSADDKTDSGDDLTRSFNRHRPGACPEGPPCKVGN